MRRIIAAAATFAVASTLLAGVTWAEARHRQARLAARPAHEAQPSKRPSDEVGTILGVPNALPVPHFGGY